jgi:hypothetical protein
MARTCGLGSKVTNSVRTYIINWRAFQALVQRLFSAELLQLNDHVWVLVTLSLGSETAEELCS